MEDPNNLCSICLEPLIIPHGESENRILNDIKLPRCGHNFHWRCFGLHGELSPTPESCPLCRAPVRDAFGRLMVQVTPSNPSSPATPGYIDFGEILDEERYFRDHPQEEKRFTFLTSATDGDVDTVRRLLADGIDVNCTYELGGTSALSMAAVNDHPGVVGCLLEHRADVHIKDEEGQTALDLAMELNCRKVIPLLREAASLA